MRCAVSPSLCQALRCHTPLARSLLSIGFRCFACTVRWSAMPVLRKASPRTAIPLRVFLRFAALAQTTPVRSRAVLCASTLCLCCATRHRAFAVPLISMHCLRYAAHGHAPAVPFFANAVQNEAAPSHSSPCCCGALSGSSTPSRRLTVPDSAFPLLCFAGLLFRAMKYFAFSTLCKADA